MPAFEALRILMHSAAIWSFSTIILFALEREAEGRVVDRVDGQVALPQGRQRGAPQQQR